MKNTQQGFIGIILVVILALALGASGTYYVLTKQKIQDGDSVSTTTINVSVPPANENKHTVSDTYYTAPVPGGGSSAATTSTPTTAVSADATYSISGETLSVIDGGKTIQTISLDHDGDYAFNLFPSNNIKAFATDVDLNFDGHNDVVVLSSTGYMGVNYFYNVYYYNPQTKMLVKATDLKEISSPTYDLANKKIHTETKSGPGYVQENFAWNGTAWYSVK